MIYTEKIFEMGSEHFAHKMFFVMNCEHIVNSNNKRFRAKMSQTQMVNKHIKLYISTVGMHFG
jgi:hypothetical protein